jgi:hypothetical protein
VAWDHVERTLAVPEARQRLVPTGVTVSLGWETGRCLARVGSDVTRPRQRTARDGLVAALAADDLLDDGTAPGAASRGVGLTVSGGLGSITGTQRLLHLDGWAG